MAGRSERGVRCVWMHRTSRSLRSGGPPAPRPGWVDVDRRRHRQQREAGPPRRPGPDRTRPPRRRAGPGARPRLPRRLRRRGSTSPTSVRCTRRSPGSTKGSPPRPWCTWGPSPRPASPRTPPPSPTTPPPPTTSSPPPAAPGSAARLGVQRDRARAAVRRPRGPPLPARRRGVPAAPEQHVLAGQDAGGGDGAAVLPLGARPVDGRAAVLQRHGPVGLRAVPRPSTPTRGCAAGTCGATSTAATARRPCGSRWSTPRGGPRASRCS